MRLILVRDLQDGEVIKSCRGLIRSELHQSVSMIITIKVPEMSIQDKDCVVEDKIGYMRKENLWMEYGYQ